MGAPVRQSDFVGDLCIALAHRWEPRRLFMVLTSYFDESGTHGGSPVTIMAAVLGTANQWRNLQRKLDNLKSSYGFRTFHTKDFRARSGEFRGWTPKKCISLVRELVPLTADGLMHAHVCSLDNAAFEAEYRSGTAPRKLALDSRYGLCFRTCLLKQTLEVIDSLSYHRDFAKTRLNVIVESGHKNAGAAESIFHQENQNMQALGFNLLSAITFADKKSCDPLMIADFLAYSTFMRPDKGLVEPHPFVPPPAPEKTGLTHLSFENGGLALLRSSLIERLNAKRAFGASRRVLESKGTTSE